MKFPTHILVIRLSALGDVAMTVPVLKIAAEAYPDIKFTILTRKQFFPLFDDIPSVDVLEADVYGRHKGLGLLKLASEAKALGIDAVADLHNVIRSKVIRSSFRASGIRIEVIDKGRIEKKALTRPVNKDFRPLTSSHERYADVFRKLGMEIRLDEAGFLATREVTPRLHQFIGKHTRKAIGIAPFAAYKSKIYSLEKMQSVISELDKGGKFQIFLFGGGLKEEQMLSEWEHQYKNVRNVAGQLTFSEELSLISNLDLMVSMDSGNGHLAAMFGVPVITLWGVTHPFSGFQPFLQPLSNCIMPDREDFPEIPTSIYGNKFPSRLENVMDRISVEEITTKIKAVLA